MLDRFAAHLRYKGYSEATIKRRLITLRQLERFMAPADLLDVTLDDLESFLGQWPNKETRRGYRGDVRHLFSWAKRRGLIEVDPSAELEGVRPVHKEAEPLPRDVVVAMLAAPDATTRRMVYLAAYGGLRAQEIVALCGRDVDLEHGTLRVGLSKGGHGRVIPLLPELAAELGDVGPGLLFPGMSKAAAAARIKRLLRRHGLPGARPHQLRTTFATSAAVRLRGDLVAVASLLGHRNVATTQRYVRFWQPSAEELRGLYGDAA